MRKIILLTPLLALFSLFTFDAFGEPHAYCEPGEYTKGGEDPCSCYPCPAGEICLGGDFHCNGVAYDQGLGAYTCPSGYYLPYASTTCESCPAGKTCPGGTFAFYSEDQGYDTSGEITCGTGEYYSYVSDGCKKCPVGFWCEGGKFAIFYHGVTTNQGIHQCPNATPISPEGSDDSSDCTAITCSAGTYLPANSITCLQCKSGYYCLGGTFGKSSSAQGLTACNSATPFSPAGSISAAACSATIACPAGTYLPANELSCAQCPANSYCAGGSFGASNNAQGITACGSATPISPAGSDDSSDCTAIACPAGEFLPMGKKECSPCYEGYYCDGKNSPYSYDDKNNQGLTQCPVATPYSNKGAKSEGDCYAKSIDCKAGYYVVKGENKCTICPTGSYCIGLKGASVDDTKDQGIEQCPNATPYSKSGSDNQSQCFDTVTCKAGEYLPTFSYSNCKTCPAGSYCKGGKYPYSETNDQGMTACDVATPFSEVGSDDATDCKANLVCLAGTFLLSGGQTCSTCYAGSWCNGGTFTNNASTQGITKCDTATPFSPDGATSSTQCTATISCQAGEFLAQGGIQCKNCWEGYYCDGTKSPYSYDDKNDQGIEKCPAATPYSDGGAKSDKDCYAKTNDITCSAGEFLSKDNKCETCWKNYYCKGGTWTPDDKEHGLDECPAATPYSDGGAKSDKDCYAKTGDITCSAGEFLNIKNECETCWKNYYCKGGTWTPDDKEHGLDECPAATPYSDGGAKSEKDCYAQAIDCNAGYYVVKGENKCTVCPTGSYCIGLKGASVDDTKDQGIEKCPNATPYSRSGSEKQSQCFDTDTCNAGEFLGAGKEHCTTCEPGFYCKGGKYSYSEKDDNGAESCSKDKPFSERGSDDATDCRASIACFPGTYLPGGSKVCLICPAGSWCGGGTFVFNDQKVNQGITACDTAKPFSPKASTSASACSATISCPAGEFLYEKGLECSTCKEGHYCDGTKSPYSYDDKNTQGITQCPDKTDSNPGATSESDCGVRCKKGTYWNGEKKGCEICPNGYYCPNDEIYSPSTSEDQGKIACPVTAPFTEKEERTTESECQSTLKCGEGEYLPKGERVCKKCKAGFYCEGKSGALSYNVNIDQGITQCDSKAPFSDEGNSDSSKCFDKINCGGGEFLPSGAKSCKKCLRGYYCDGKSSPYSFNANADQGIAQCDKDTPFSEEGTSDGSKCFAKLTCDAGYYLPAGAQKCAECTSGSYCEKSVVYEFDSSKAQGIESCPQNEPNSPAGSKDKGDCYAILTCSAGTYFNPGKKDGATCSECGAGDYCAGGTFKSNSVEIQGVENCPKSDPNSDSGAASEADCYVVSCKSGEYLPKGSDKCSSCPDGETCNGGKMKYSAKGNRGISLSCDAGYYLPAGSSDCDKCPMGYYCEGLSDADFDEENDQGITQCPASRPFSGGYSQDSSACRAYKECQSGTYLPAGALECAQCLSGYYCTHGSYQFNANNAQGLTACSGATPNSLPGATNAGACFAGTCAAGTYLPKGASTCATCPAGFWCGGGNYTFSDQIDQGAVQCNNATPFSEAGSDESSDCHATVACVMGTYLPANSQTCETCLAGYYCDGANSPYSFSANAQGLTQCDNAKPFSNPGATSDGACYASITCAAGTYLNGTVCETCPANYYCAGNTFNTNNGQQGLTPCDNNTPYSNPGAQSSGDCFAGVHCYPGDYLPANSSTREYCPENYYCPGGTYPTNQSNDQGINACPAQTPYSCGGNWATQASDCYATISCAAGTYLPRGATQCVTCPAGSYCPGENDLRANANCYQSDQGVESCGALTNGSFPNSDAGATGFAQCYSTSGTDTCANLNPVEHGAATYANVSASYRNYNGMGMQTTPSNACDITSLTCDSGYADTPAGPFGNTAYYANASNWSQSNTKIRNLDGTDWSGNASSLSNGESEVTWNNGAKIHMIASCNTTDVMSEVLSAAAQAQIGDDEIALIALIWAENGVGTRPGNTFSQGTTGASCWVKIDGYTPAGGSAQSVTNQRWLFAGTMDADKDKGLTATQVCAQQCMYLPIDALFFSPSFKAELGELASQRHCKYSPITCAAGTYLPANANDSAQCTTCTAGNYCPGGDFSQSTSVQGLNACPTEMPNSPAGSTNAGACYASVTCPAGQYLPMGQLTCAPCTNGNYCLGGTFNSNVVADQGLTACDVATPMSPTGATSAAACSAGVNCVAGTYLPADASECVACPAGSWCGGGIFGFNANAAQGITQCDSETPESPANSTSANDCYTTITCAAGQYLPSGETTCADCTVGNYCAGGDFHSNVATAQGLTQCPNGTPFSEVGASANTQCYANLLCLSGTYLPANSLVCATCLENNYCVGGVFGYSTTVAQGMTACPNTSPYAPAGSTQASACTEEERIICAAGTYLPANSLVCVTCPIGTYCAGGLFTQSNTDQGIKDCPTDTNGITGTSAAGAKSQYQCYATTTVTCADYNKVDDPNRLSITYANTTASAKDYYNGDTYFYTVLDIIGACAITAVTCDTTKSVNSGYTGPLANYTFFTPMNNTRARTIGNDTSGSCNSDNISGLDNGEFEVTYTDNTKIKGIASCYDKGDEFVYCGCTLTGYSINNATMVPVTANNLSGIVKHTDRASCECKCPVDCARVFKSRDQFTNDFINIFFGHLGDQLFCTDKISVDWYNENTLVESNTCTYNQSATLPSSTPTREGYTFNGWVIDNN